MRAWAALDRLQDFNGTSGARKAGTAADVEQVEVEATRSPSAPPARLRHAPRRGEPSLICSRHVGGDLVLHLDQTQGRAVILGPAAPHGRYISKPEVLQLPEQANRRVAARAEIAEKAVLSASEPSARIAEGQARDQRAKRACLRRIKVA